MLISRDTYKSFKKDGDLLKTMTNLNFNVDHSSPQDQKLIYEFAKEMKFIIKQKIRKSAGDESVTRLLESTAIMASGNSTLFLLEHPTNFGID